MLTLLLQFIRKYGAFYLYSHLAPLGGLLASHWAELLNTKGYEMIDYGAL